MKANITRGINHALGLYTRLLNLLDDTDTQCGVYLLLSEWVESEDLAAQYFQEAEIWAARYSALKAALQEDLQYN